ncbi:dipeptidase [Rhodocista pekingensis]|uniref:Dipeptidase n=1 Tax=Rhodocista pekingensis TaxID=201185 RepID=A0ABW2L0A4_9PROT
MPRDMTGRPRIVWDNHACMPLRRDASFLPQLQRLRESGFTMVSLNVGMDQTPATEIMETAAFFRDWIEARPDEYCLAGSTEDVVDAAATGRLGVAFDIEGAGSLAVRPEFAEIYRSLGVRWISLVYNRTTGIGGGCHDDDPGLTAAGARAVQAIQEAGMVVCLSHTGWRTARDVLERADRPVIFSHSNPHALKAHGRNIGDDLIRACAATGGVVGINGVDLFLGGEPTPERIAAHVAYVADLVGPQHVGLALDYAFDQEELRAWLHRHRDRWSPELGYRPDIAIAPPESLGGIVEALTRLGFAAPELDMVLGGNWLRVARRCWNA